MDFEQVVRDYWTQVFYFVLARVRDREVAADLTQECFWKAYRGWERFRGDASVYTWLRHIALNTVYTFLRSRRPQYWQRTSDLSTIEEMLPHPGPSAESNLVRRQRFDAVRQAAESLPSRQQMAFVLRFDEEKGFAEIARLMNITEGAAKVHVFRAVQSLRKAVRARK
jgi:RNA polymerase sigma-70 factor (ECF subfamily)